MQTITLPAGRKDASRAAAFIQALPADRAWSVKVEEFKAKRSTSQNNYLHGVCYKTLGDAIGFDPKDIAEYLLGTYFGWKERKVPKSPRFPEGVEQVPVRTTTTDADGKRNVLSKQAFSDYVAFIHRLSLIHI